MKYLLFLIGVFPLPIYAQEIPTLRTGIYNSFYNFVNNRPLPAQIQIITSQKNLPDSSEAQAGTSDRRYIYANQIRFLPDIKVKRRNHVRRNMWGFYDGEHVYVNSKIYTESSFVCYSRLLHFGRYCYFYGAEDVRKRTGGAISGLVGTLPIHKYYLLDMSDGSMLRLTPQVVEAIVKEYPALHERFKKSQKYVDDLLELIEAYNQQVR